MTRIRVATSLDRDDIREIHLCAFPEGEKRIVSTLAVNLLSEETNTKTLSLVAEADGAVVGHIAFSPVTVNNNKSWKGYILAPLGVKPEYQKRHIGSKLIESGMARLSKMGVNVLFVYGDPNYYEKFGFDADTASGYSPPYELQYPFGWQAIILNEGVFTKSSVKISCVEPLHDPELW
ncbi:MAG: N-acetyltransferase [Desulfobacterales bacterium]|jgi:putative acetyltransferase